MNIIGEGFNTEILGQINQRQKIYGAAYRTNQILSYLNSRTGWCKLISGAEVITEPRAGLKLPKAQDYVLFNGMVDEGKSLGSGGRAGIARTNSVYTNTAYGLGGLQLGERPMPGIISADIKTETRGSLKTANVKIKAWNTTQFDIIDVLYLRLGYSLLLEWGHSSYYNNSGVYIPNNPHSIADTFLGDSLDYDGVLKLIQNKRLESNGNYDALFGKLVNFSWTFANDMSYDIDLTIRSVGDVIESLKCNMIAPVTTKTDPAATTTPPPTGSAQPEQPTLPPEPTPDDIIVAAKDKNSISKFFYECQQKFGTSGQYNFSPYRANAGMKWLTNVVTSNDKKEHIDVVQQLFVGGDNGKDRTEYYIRLGSFFDFFQNNISPAFKDKNNRVITSLKFNSDTESNLIYIAPRQISADPRICIFKKTFISENSESYMFYECEEFERGVGNNLYGKLMNIYLNFTFILGELDRLKDQDGNIKLIDFLQSLVAGICDATGNFNKLDVIISPNQDDLVTIIDEVPLPDRNTLLTELGISTTEAIFDVYGYYQRNEIVSGSSAQHGGFIKDFQMRTEITPQMASMITIGSTSNGNIVGSDATALSKMNKGIIDRYKVAVKDPSSPVVENTQSLQEKFSEALNNFQVFVRDLSSISFTTKPQWNLKAIDAYKATIKDFLTYDQAKISEETGKGSPTIGFLPFNLTLKMDGLSGMKVYQKYTIDTSFLPTNYPNNLDFLIRSVNNSISNNVWETTIESIAVPNNISGTGGAASLKSAQEKASSRGGTTATVTTTSVISNGGNNVNPTLKSKDKSNIIKDYGWPILVSQPNGGTQFFGEVISKDPRNVYKRDEQYIKQNVVSFTFNSQKKKGFTLKFNFHKALVDPMTKVLTQIDNAGLIEYAKNIQATIYTRDTTNSPGNLSGHAFGVAMDVNPDKFPYGAGGYAAYQSAIKNSKSPNYKYARVVQIIAESGLFNWGGNYGKNKDAHHFSVKPYNI
jgi:hypothetical protein